MFQQPVHLEKNWNLQMKLKAYVHCVMLVRVILFTVTDKETRVCVDPGRNEATMNMGGGGVPGLPGGGGRNEQLVPSSGGGQTFIGC
jgi:hypothetical protein